MSRGDAVGHTSALASILSKLREISEVEATGEKALAREGHLGLVEKATALSRLETRFSITIFITLKNR